ncbi:MAG: ATP-binding cassette domain-containing protein [Alphaproteobacteria bacterium]|nr:MAG: ATP-binding cassette domain-containing protein [Alphaproteobacteria bacterium]TAF15413.1 MAG: ATP-binding cassette domain-containing protein [Alphaproteobacteria bacterium]TAF39361.1 MAG: ATP-binding cassette domain-containing protein [Alphaproteobacteria bacterium]TAF75671.1 MAG: ATP-binding cassette domain-containing protein [Alphaproteobacteria bacterium]
MITCQHVFKSYASHQPILRDVNFSLRAGGYYLLTGRSGAGKSTLLNILSLNMLPSQGDVFMFGQNVAHLGRDVLPLVRRRIGCVYQNYRLFNHLTVAENIALPQKVMGVSPREYRRKTEELLHWVHLEHHRDSLPVMLSGGEKQRVAIARAVINNPSIILADEPTGNLDPELSKKVMYLFDVLNQQGATVFIATHDPRLMEQSKHHILEIADGQVHERVRPSKTRIYPVE